MNRLLGDAELRQRMGREAGRALVLRGVLDRGNVRGQSGGPKGAGTMKSLR